MEPVAGSPPPPPLQQPSSQSPKRGLGCFTIGCLSLIIALGGLVLLLGIGGWFFYSKAVDVFTTQQPVIVAIAQPSDAEFLSAESGAQSSGKRDQW
jgi:hypothetical protein